MSFGNIHKGTMKGSNESVNYICMNGLFRKKKLCKALISFSKICAYVRKDWSPAAVVPPQLRPVIKAT